MISETVISVRVPSITRAKISKIARRKNISMSEAVRRIIVKTFKGKRDAPAHS